MSELKIYRMNEMVPSLAYATRESACFDVAACLGDRPSVKGFEPNNKSMLFVCLTDEKGVFIRIPPRYRVLIPTGMIFNIDKEHHVKIWARSGLAVKKGLAMANGVGIIDSDYTEEIFVPMINNSDEELVIRHGDRVAQGEMIFNGSQASFTYIQERPGQKGDRNGGFGSTGVSK
jgi:dUTP pyrophosphatase